LNINNHIHAIIEIMTDTKKPTFKELELTFGQKCYIKFCDLLGMKIFKKYWPTKGSVWNGRHINKLLKSDLEFIIEDANVFTASHTQSIIIETIIAVTYLMTKKNLKNITPIIIGLGIIHTYALLCHQYNKV
jgi:hypothetical protein